MGLPVVSNVFKGLGSLLNHGAKKKQAKDVYENDQKLLQYKNATGQQGWDADEYRRNAKGSILKGLAQAAGLEKLFPPGYLESILQHRGFINAPQLKQVSDGESMLGSALNSIGGQLTPKYGSAPSPYMSGVGGVYQPQQSDEEDEGDGDGGGFGDWI